MYMYIFKFTFIILKTNELSYIICMYVCTYVYIYIRTYILCIIVRNFEYELKLVRTYIHT